VLAYIHTTLIKLLHLSRPSGFSVNCVILGGNDAPWSRLVSICFVPFQKPTTHTTIATASLPASPRWVEQVVRHERPKRRESVTSSLHPSAALVVQVPWKDGQITYLKAFPAILITERLLPNAPSRASARICSVTRTLGDCVIYIVLG
jgi:hypothetical protein